MLGCTIGRALAPCSTVLMKQADLILQKSKSQPSNFMPTEAPSTPNIAESKNSLLDALGTGFQMKAAGKLTADDPNPPGFENVPTGDAPPSPAPQPAPAQPPAQTATPSPVVKPAPVVTKSTVPPEVEAKRTATAQQWKEVNAERDQLRSELKTLQEEKAKWGETQRNNEETALLKAKLTEFDTILRQVAAERHPDLIGPINAKIESAVKLAQTAVGKEQADAVSKILRAPDSEERDTALDSILDGLSTTKRARLIKAMTDVEEANGQRSMLAEHSQQALSQREQALKQRHEQNLAQFDAEAADWTDPAHGIELLVEKPGDVGHNERRNAILSNAKALFSGQVSSPRDLARAAIWSAFGETLNRQNLALMQQNKQLMEEITKIKGGGPGLENANGSANGDASTATEKPANMPLAEWIAKTGVREGVQFGRTG